MAGHRRTVKEFRLDSLRTIMWTFPDRSRPNFHCQGDKTGGPPPGLARLTRTQCPAARFGYGSEVRVCPWVIDTSLPSITPLVFTSYRKFVPFTDWRV